MGLLIGVALAVLLGAGGFYAVWSGMILGQEKPPEKAEKAEKLSPLDKIAFVKLDPLVISLGPQSSANHLRFQAQLEVDSDHYDDVTELVPRVVDVLNSYLRAVDPAELADPGSLTRLRSQMLRRVQIVAGEDYVRDLLIMEFVLN